MSSPYLAEIRVVSFGFPPKGWALCNGQLLPINQNQALFSLLGTTFGGDGRTTFGLPNLQGRAPRDAGNQHLLGEVGGEAAHTLLLSEMPTHNHVMMGTTGDGSQADPTGQVPANVRNTTGIEQYRHAADTTMGATVAPTGGSQPHDNMQPYLVLNFIIALQGIYPPRS